MSSTEKTKRTSPSAKRFIPTNAKNAPGIRWEVRCEIRDFLHGVTANVRNSEALSREDIAAALVQLDRFLKKITKRKNEPVYLTEASYRELCDLSLFLTRAYWRSLRREPETRQINLGNKFTAACFGLLFRVVQATETESSWVQLAIYMDACRDLGLKGAFEKLPVQASRPSIENHLIKALNIAVNESRLEDIQTICALSVPSQAFKNQLRQALQAAYSDRAAIMPNDLQEWLAHFLDIGQPSLNIEYASPAEAPATRQTAAFLLSLSDHSGDSAYNKDIFETFRTICQNNFNLMLNGQVGVVTDFDHRRHEYVSPPESRGKVRLVRPWVEWTSQNRSSIVIKALVEPAVEGSKSA